MAVIAGCEAIEAFRDGIGLCQVSSDCFGQRPGNDGLREHEPRKREHQMDLIADHISHRFGALEVLDDVSFTVRVGRGGRDRRSLRLRQEHAAVDPRRAVAAERGRRRNCAARRRRTASTR